MLAWLPVPAGSSAHLTGDEQEALDSWKKHHPEAPVYFEEAGVAGSEAVVAIWNLNAWYTGEQLWDDLKNVDFEPRQIKVCHRQAGAGASSSGAGASSSGLDRSVTGSGASTAPRQQQ